MAHDDQFTATGPSFTGSGFPRAAFSSRARDMEYGVNVQGTLCGVYGESVRASTQRKSSVDGVGVYGFGETFGLIGNGNRGLAGVLGQNNRGRTGVAGATMRGGTGVLGASLRNLGNPLETFARTPAPTEGGAGVGVHGLSGSGYGILGESQGNAAVVGRSVESAGVWGAVTAPDGGYGVLGEGRDNAGVVGRSVSSVGVWGHGDRGVVGTSSADGSTGLAGHFVGRLLVQGDLAVTGVKGAVVPHPDGSHRVMCAIESPQSWFEDFGESALTQGAAGVTLDPDFAALVDVSDGAYQVFLTPYGDCDGLYVAERTAEGFRVREQRDGTSNVPFGYRIVARRRDVTAARLDAVRVPALSTVPSSAVGSVGGEPVAPLCPRPL